MCPSKININFFFDIFINMDFKRNKNENYFLFYSKETNIVGISLHIPIYNKNISLNII
jgi:hypothetical protein